MKQQPASHAPVIRGAGYGISEYRLVVVEVVLKDILEYERDGDEEDYSQGKRLWPSARRGRQMGCHCMSRAGHANLPGIVRSLQREGIRLATMFKLARSFG